MLAKTNRLKKQKDFERIFKKGKGTKEGFLVFRMIKNNFANSRFGFVVGKNVSKKANVRNKIKRRMRESLRKKIKEIRGGVDGVFIARPGLEKKDYQELDAAINKIINKMNLFKKV